MLTLCWLRRDLRLHDNAALYHALRSGHPVQVLFIFDDDILKTLPRRDRRVIFIYRQLQALHARLAALGATLLVRQGRPTDVFERLLREFSVAEVHAARDYEPYATTRDAAVSALLQAHGAALCLHKDQCIFETGEILKKDGSPYTVFTPYSRRWRETCTDFFLKSYPTEAYFSALYRAPPEPLPTLQSVDFEDMAVVFPEKDVALPAHYATTRNLPAAEAGTSRLSVHLRFGTLSVRELARRAEAENQVFLTELIWRDFFFQILHHFPHVGEGQAFRPAYDRIRWRNDEADFAAWTQGRTGYPLVDAGMRQLNATGLMHNRVRMVTASFLCKHLLIDWRWGEAYFAEKLNDYDLSANNGNWQWAAGSGCDAAPYFRVFNPLAQQQKFDPQEHYIRAWLPEYGTCEYPRPIVEHAFGRQRALAAYRKALQEA